MISPNLPPGTEIDCIDASHHDIPTPLVKGQIYTIAGYKWSDFAQDYGVVLKEVRHSPAKAGFKRSRFRLPIYSGLDALWASSKREEVEA